MWIKDPKIYGPLSTNTLKRYVEYYHGSIGLINASVGIKIWMLFFTD
jgi:hypothetical protein